MRAEKMRKSNVKGRDEEYVVCLSYVEKKMKRNMNNGRYMSIIMSKII